MRLTQLWTTIVGTLLGFAGTASAQFPNQQQPQNNYLQNYFNPQYQPLSPYLNLNRNANPAASYYFGVRPGTLGVGPSGFRGTPGIAPGGIRPLFFPQLVSAPDPLVDPTFGLPGNVLPPAGHPVVFGNTMGFFPGPTGQAGGSRSGVSGLGAGRR